MTNYDLLHCTVIVMYGKQDLKSILKLRKRKLRRKGLPRLKKLITKLV